MQRPRSGYPYCVELSESDVLEKATAPTDNHLRQMFERVYFLLLATRCAHNQFYGFLSSQICGVVMSTTNKLCANKISTCKQHSPKQQEFVREAVFSGKCMAGVAWEGGGRSRSTRSSRALVIHSTIATGHVRFKRILVPARKPSAAGSAPKAVLVASRPTSQRTAAQVALALAQAAQTEYVHRSRACPVPWFPLSRSDRPTPTMMREAMPHRIPRTAAVLF